MNNNKKKPNKESLGKKFNRILNTPIGSKSNKKENNSKLSNYERIVLNGDETAQDLKQYQNKKIAWKYIAKNTKGKKVTGYFYSYTKNDVRYFLESEGLEVVSVTTNKFIQMLNKDLQKGKRIKTRTLVFMLTEMSTYIKSGIPLSEAIGIMIKETKNKRYKNILREMRYDLNSGDSLSKAMIKRGNAFPSILINMVKTAEMTGGLAESLDDMAAYFGEIEETRRQMVSILTYPTIVFAFTIAVVMFIMIYVIPKFVEIYSTMESTKIPAFTQFVIGMSQFLQNNLTYILLIIIVILSVFLILYRKVKEFRNFFQKIGMRLPFIGNIMIYNEVTVFSKTFATLLRHDVYITESMQILNQLTNNEVYHEMINDTIENLKKGEKISLAFKDHWAFPIPAYEMIVTGEKTGKLADMMEQVSKYYQSLHKSSIMRLKSLIEPFVIILLAFLVGSIILAVVVPMFSMYESVQNLG